MVFLILIGASVFSLVFRGFGGDQLVEELLTRLPGGVLGAMLVVMLVMFFLGFVLDFIEITFVVVPIVGPILLAMGLDPVLPDSTLWFCPVLSARCSPGRRHHRRYLSRRHAVYRHPAGNAGLAGAMAGIGDLVARPRVWKLVCYAFLIMEEPMTNKIVQGTILLVEDNQDDVELTLRAFKRGHLLNDVVVKRDGQEALDYLHGADDAGKPNPLPVVTLLDLNMPRLNGLQVLQKMRAHEHTSNVPVVILTTSDEERDVIDSYHLGANSYIRKPVDSKEFFEAIQSLELYWNLRPEITE
jgi:CheY-like chemotaxis protein